MSTPKKRQHPDEVPDAHLLDQDNDNDQIDEVVINDNYNDLFDNAEHPGGKQIRITDSYPSKSPRTPLATPPRGKSPRNHDNHDPDYTPGSIPKGHHCTKLDIYIHSTRNPSLQRILSTEHACNATFFANHMALNKILTRARQLLLRQEPFFTLMNTGHSFNLGRPQLSYKVYAIDENSFIDLVADLTPEGAANNTLPFFEQVQDKHISQTDISFFFDMDSPKEQAKPASRDKATSTFDSEILSPVIDALRQAVTPWATELRRLPQPQHEQARASTSAPMQPISLANAPPPRHQTGPQPILQRLQPEQSDRPRTSQRLGPPVQHGFRDRSRSYERPRDARDFRERRRRHQQ